VVVGKRVDRLVAASDRFALADRASFHCNFEYSSDVSGIYTSSLRYWLS
jgi:hypothetical protein